MSQVIFWDVDTQVDFMLPGRPLYVPGSDLILPRLEVLTSHARSVGIPILGSEDSHTTADPEIAPDPNWVTTFPPHCLAGTPGQLRVKETAPANPLYVESPPMPVERLERMIRGHRGEVYFRKQTFDVFSNPNVEPVLAVFAPTTAVVYGVAQDVCVRCAVDGFLLRGAEVVAVTDATAALDAARGRELQAGWRARGVRLLTTAQVLQEYAAVAA